MLLAENQMLHVRARKERMKEQTPRIEANKKKKELQDNTINIYLSSRGWGDYSPVEVRVDQRKSDKEILAICKKALEESHDVDDQDQSDAKILAKIKEAREESASQNTVSMAGDTVEETMANEYMADKIKTKERDTKHSNSFGYCHICHSYCYGDCEANQ